MIVRQTVYMQHIVSKKADVLFIVNYSSYALAIATVKIQQ